MIKKTFTLKVLRYRPEGDDKPFFQDFTIDCPADWVLLDALIHIQETLDETLSFRYSCHMSVCGSCAVMLNGSPVLACKAFLRDMKDTTAIVEPLAHFPIERDLIIDMTDFAEKIEKIHPYLIAKDHDKHEPCKQTAEALDKYLPFAQCINCMLCYAACPQASHYKDFLGPAALTLAHRYNLDSRDQGRRIRNKQTGGEDGVWHCTYVGACSDVCPKHVNPGAAIQQMKIAYSLDWLIEQSARALSACKSACKKEET